MKGPIAVSSTLGERRGLSMQPDQVSFPCFVGFFLAFECGDCFFAAYCTRTDLWRMSQTFELQ